MEFTLALLTCFSWAAGLEMPLATPTSLVQLLGFSGDQQNYDESAPHFRWTGHVGLRYRDTPQVLYGFTPNTPLLNDTKSLVNVLLDGQRFPGRVADDAKEFDDATRSPYGQIFVFWDVPKEKCLYEDCGFSVVRDDAQRSAESAAKFYAFPPEAPRKYRQLSQSSCDENWGDSCFNCATYPQSVGLPIPDDTGMLPGYLIKLAQEPKALCRCYKSGRWLQGFQCEAPWTKGLMNACKFDDPSHEL